MFCNQCGNTLPEGVMFCPVCGAKCEPAQPAAAPAQQPAQPAAAPAQQPAQPAAAPAQQPMQSAAVPAAAQKNAAKLPMKLLIPIAAGAALLIIILVAVLALGGRKGGSYDTYADKVLKYGYDSQEIFVYPNTEKAYEVEEENLGWVDHNGDGSRIIFTAYDDGDETKLYYMDGDLEAKLIAEDVYTGFISYTGEYVAYLQDVEDGVAGDLYLYCVKNGNITKVDSGVYPERICLSPDGKTVCYIKDYESYDDNKLYVATAGKTGKEIDSDGCYPIAVANGGKYVYYLNDSSKLYLYNGKESEKIASGISYYEYVNKDATEILYTKDGKIYYHSVKMKEAVKLASDDLMNVVLASDAVFFSPDYGCNIAGISTFKGAVIAGYDNLYWINTKGTDAVKICSNSGEYQLSADGKSLIFVKSGDLYKIKKLGEDMKETLLCDEMYVSNVVASLDLSKIYVATDEEELYYVKGENKFVELSDDLDSAYDVVYNIKMDKIFFIEDDTLCYAGTSEKSVEEVEDDVTDVWQVMYGIAFEVEDEDSVFYMDSKKVIEIED